jgi:uncharacterized protein
MRAVRSLCILLLLAVFQPWAAAQDFDFRPPASASDPGVAAVMRDLAERMLPVYQEDNPERYLANLSALQLVAGNYTAAYESRQSLRERRRNTGAGRPADRGVILDMYARARAIEATDRMPFAQAFTKAYGDTIPRLNDLDAYAVLGWLGAAPAQFQDPVQRMFDQRRAKGNIALVDAVNLVHDYAWFEAYRNFAPLVGALNTADEQRRYATEDDIQIEVHKGVTIAAALVRPTGPQKPLPALLEYTTYLTPGFALEAAAHGYVGVIAYARGRGKSTGAPLPYQHDGDDVRAVINWIAKQDWSDGRVGMYGTAYSGFTGWAAAKKLPPALKAIAMTSPTAPGIDVPDDGGVFRNSAYRWSLYATNAIDEKTYNDDAPWRQLDQAWYTSGLPYRDLGSLWGTADPFVLRWLNHPSYDRFWQSLIPYGREMAKIDIPVLTITGYYAAGEGGALYYYKEQRRWDPHANHTLLIGPYDNGVTERGVQPALRGYTVDPAALVDLRELRYEWFDSVFKGAQTPALLKDRVNFEVMGANEWRHAPSLDAMGNGTLKLYLDPTAVGASHLLTQRASPGKLKGKSAKAKANNTRADEKAKQAEREFVDQTVNLADRGDVNSNWQPTDIASHNVEVRNATNYVSQPLPRAIEVQGAWSGRLDLTINKMDVDLRIAAYELLPSGDYVQLFEPYVFRASYAQDRTHRRLLKAGERQTINFRLERLTSRKLQAGSRLVLVLGVNKRPDQEINYGSGEDVSEESLEDEGDKLPVKIQWYGDSYIDIPVRR